MTESSYTPSRIAVLSCIHGNIAALEVVWDDLRRQCVDRVVCLGDLVGYGPYPNEVIRFIQRENIRTIRGCWDEGIGLENEDCGCKFMTEEDATHGHEAFVWTRKTVTDSHRKFLADLPFGYREVTSAAGSLLFVHGSPRNASEYLMESTHDLILLERAAAAKTDVLLCGHTHVPFSRQIEGVLRVRAEASLKDRIQRDLGMIRTPAPREVLLAPKLIVNAGSVGEPRDGGTEATYVIFNTGTGATEIRRVAYDVEQVAKAILKSGLPSQFAHRLLHGAELAPKNKESFCAC